jgi:hypothetical protein
VVHIIMMLTLPYPLGPSFLLLTPTPDAAGFFYQLNIQNR